MLRSLLNVKPQPLVRQYLRTRFESPIRLCKTSATAPRPYEITTIGGFPIGDTGVQKYLENLRIEFYDLQTRDNLDKLQIKRMSTISHIVELYEQQKILKNNLNSLSDIKDEKDEEMKELIKEERDIYTNILNKLNGELMDSLITLGEAVQGHASDVVVEVTAGVGGQEAMLFANELMDMYINYLDYKGWSYTILSMENTEIGGLRHGSVLVSSHDAYKYLQYEGGVHRVQRIPATEKSGRIHTSTVTVAVIPRPDDFELNLKDKDIKIETKRASGAGGQHVNTTDSAVRIVHLPTGIAVECQTDRSQIKNKEIALKKLQAKLYQQHYDNQMKAQSQSRKSQVGTSNRNEKIRTYNYNQDRITDHRIESGTMHHLVGFLEGNLLLDELLSKLHKSACQKNLMDMISNIDN